MAPGDGFVTVCDMNILQTLRRWARFNAQDVSTCEQEQTVICKWLQSVSSNISNSISTVSESGLLMNDFAIVLSIVWLID